MKKFAALLMILSLSVFSVGCEEADDDTPAADGAVGADMDDAAVGDADADVDTAAADADTAVE